MDTIDNELTQAEYANALTLGPDAYEAISISVWNESVVMQVYDKPDGHQQQGSWGSEQLVAPSSVTIQRAAGVRFRTNPGGAAGRIVASAWREGEPLVTGGLQLQGTLGGGGGVTPPVSSINGVTGIISAAGLIAGGTGFTVVKGAAGVYSINYTVPFAALPVVLIGAVMDIFGTAVVSVQNQGTFTVNFQTVAGVPTDTRWSFAAIAIQ